MGQRTALDKCATDQWSPADLKQFLLHLATAVEELHELGQTHGDLSPANIMVRSTEGRPRPVLVDTVDFTTDEAGRKTPAYCPPHDSDLRVRDRFAVGQIAAELADRCQDQETKAAVLLGVSKCGEGTAPSLTLKALKDALAPRKAQPPIPSFELSIETPRAVRRHDTAG